MPLTNIFPRSYRESQDQTMSAASSSVVSFSRDSRLSSLTTVTSSQPSVANSARTTPVTYVFLPVEHSFNAMVLQTQDAVIPLYHIFVRMNCFIPSSYITTVSRGDTEFGEEVGHFEMGVSIRKPTVVFGGLERIIDSVLTRSGSRGAVRIESHILYISTSHSPCCFTVATLGVAIYQRRIQTSHMDLRRSSQIRELLQFDLPSTVLRFTNTPR
ncbi:hypothetical protein BC629DRAFT_1523337 [Irpex lacteus]|nr:hypothetical protein BC629DRAFT_1523337 [Irpex lacteus]